MTSQQTSNQRTKQRVRSRAFCLTTFNPVKYEEWKTLDVVDNNIKYFVYQLEETKEGKKHVQGYIEFINAIGTINHIKNILQDQTVHLEVRRGTRDQARSYCMKKESQCNAPIELGKWTGQGQRSDIRAMYKLLKQGRTPAEVCEIMPSTYFKYHKAVDKVYNSIQAKQEGKYYPVEVHVLYGDAGAGKTRYVYDTHGIENVYRLCQGNAGNVWYDGYSGQDVLLIDDYYGWLKYSTFLQTIDNYRIRLSVKGGTTYSRWTKVYITSNVHPVHWYKNQGMTPAMSRRFKTITLLKTSNKNIRKPIETTIIIDSKGMRTETPGIAHKDVYSQKLLSSITNNLCAKEDESKESEFGQESEDTELEQFAQHCQELDNEKNSEYVRDIHRQRMAPYLTYYSQDEKER
jgi:hypothetical protein